MLKKGTTSLRAHIVATTEAGKSRDVARQIASLPGVKMGDACWGSRDVFAVVEVRETQELNKLVLDKIQRLDGVKETNTRIAFD
jgi:DNA-binding Lrp family transcriptional regulator